MTWPRPRPPRWLSVVLSIAVALVALPAGGQTNPFRVTHTIDKSGQAHVSVTGRVFNEAPSDAIDVYVAAEALDSAGKVIASGVSYVGAIPAGSSTPFVIKVPGARTAARYRVLVTSFRFGFTIQS